MEESEVLVVGAGPTGLFAAAELARHGVMPRVIDAQAGPSVHSKALAVQSRTLETFEDIGIATEVLDLGLRLHGANVYASGRRICTLASTSSTPPTPTS